MWEVLRFCCATPAGVGLFLGGVPRVASPEAPYPGLPLWDPSGIGWGKWNRFLGVGRWFWGERCTALTRNEFHDTRRFGLARFAVSGRYAGKRAMHHFMSVRSAVQIMNRAFSPGWKEDRNLGLRPRLV